MKLKLLLLSWALLPHFAIATVLPTPKTIQPIASTFTLDPSTALSYERELAPLAEYLQEYIPLQISSAQQSSNQALVLSLDSSMAAEAYALNISAQRIEIIGADQGGVFNGIQTLFGLLPAKVYAKQCPLPVKLACQKITDAPRFAYRGMMLDVARTWIDMEGMKRYIDLLSYHKINKLHLHLSDDEGWRIEIKSHPKLTEVGAYRGGDSPIRPVYGKWNEKYGGYYTQAQMRELIGYAALRNIEIIPEIDLPGHSCNIAHVHPEILCNYTPDTTPSNGYDMRSAWCVAKEDNYLLLNDILGEICQLFPSPFIHVGGDEVDVSQWEQCPDCRALMTREGMTDPHQLEDRFMARMNAILQAHGKLPAVWNEAIGEGTFTRDSRVYGWKNVKACLNATAKGYSTVVMPGAYFYVDMRQSPREDGHDWAAIFDAQKTYSFNFAQQGFTAGQLENVVGLQAAFWSEAYISHQPETPDYLDYMCFPRLCALSEIAWNATPQPWADFHKRLIDEHYDRMAAMDIRFRLFPPTMTTKAGLITLTTNDRSAIYYTDDGVSEPSATSKRYTAPIRTNKPHRYQFRTIYKTAKSPVVAPSAFYRIVTPALTLSTTMGESINMPYSNVNLYKTFARTQRACGQGDQINYTFATPVRCREIYLQTGNLQLPKTIVTTGYVEVSPDGKTFTKVGELEKGSITLRPTQAVKAIRIISTCDDNGCAYVTIQYPRIKPIL
ncbi:MAG: family 20 glycosylhydrolase [Alistipes sp.]